MNSLILGSKYGRNEPDSTFRLYIQAGLGTSLACQVLAINPHASHRSCLKKGYPYGSRGSHAGGFLAWNLAQGKCLLLKKLLVSVLSSKNITVVFWGSHT